MTPMRGLVPGLIQNHNKNEMQTRYQVLKGAYTHK